MKLKLALLAAVLLAAGGTAALFVRSRAPHHPPAPTAGNNAHRQGLERAMSPMVAMLHAPEGKTPCESAYNAFKVALDAATAQALPMPFVKLAKRDDFLQRCGALPVEAQRCLVPSYDAHHSDECLHARPSNDALKDLYQLPESKKPEAPGLKTVPPSGG